MKKFIGISLLLIACLVALRIDIPITLFVVSHRDLIFNHFSVLITNYVSGATILVAFFVYILWKKRENLLRYVLAVFFTAAFSIFIKNFVGRVRPFNALNLPVLPNIASYAFDSWNTSFPSWHAAAVFVVIPFLDSKWRIPWLIFALLYAFIRIYIGVHYLSDVLFGVVLGLTIGWVFAKN